MATEGALLGVLFSSYFYLRFKVGTWPPPGIDAPDPVVPFVMAGVLAVAAVPMLLASTAAQAGRARAAWLLVLAALVVQSGYFAFEIHSLLSDLDRFGPTGSAYGSAYYAVLGADHAHVAVGLLLSLWLVIRLLGGLTAYRVLAVRVVSWYWLFAVVMTFCTVGTILSANT
jgi:heme/copper-type cytochrome/quinol oxidase subunit 3